LALSEERAFFATTPPNQYGEPVATIQSVSEIVLFACDLSIFF